MLGNFLLKALISWWLQGRGHKDRSGFEGPWTSNPLKFDNSYFKWVFYSSIMPNKKLLGKFLYFVPKKRNPSSFFLGWSYFQTYFQLLLYSGCIRLLSYGPLNSRCFNFIVAKFLLELCVVSACQCLVKVSALVWVRKMWSEWLFLKR